MKKQVEYKIRPFLWYLRDGEGDGEDTPPGGGESPPTDPPGDEPPNDDGKGGKGGKGTKGDDDKGFTQEDVNNIVSRETKKATEKMLKELGIKNFDNAKEGLSEFKKWKDEQKTEAEKQAEKLSELETDKNSLSEENDTLKAQLLAIKQGVNADSVEDVVALAERQVNDTTSMEEAIKAVVKKYPQFSADDTGEEEEEEEEEKPKFSKGKHQKKKQTEIDMWIEAFRPPGVKKDKDKD